VEGGREALGVDRGAGSLSGAWAARRCERGEDERQQSEWKRREALRKE